MGHTQRKFGYTGGRYYYKKFEYDEEGNRFAKPCPRNQTPDLQSTYLYNHDRSEVLRYIRLDIDANKTLSQFKNEEGAISWQKISHEIKQVEEKLNKYFEYVTFSHSKKGLHLVIGIVPLPLEERSKSAQFMARKIQSDFISILNHVGIGADPSGKGLKQDFSTYRNTTNVVHHNEILTRKIENAAKKRPYLDENGMTVTPKRHWKMLNELSLVLDKVKKKLHLHNEGYRLYPDERREKSFAKLFLYCMGMHTPENDLKLPELTYAHTQSVELSIDQIEAITESGRRNFWIYSETDFFKELFFCEKVFSPGCAGQYRITVKDSPSISKKIQRAIKVLSLPPTKIQFHLVAPQFVSEGERNACLVSWMLALKWHGVCEEVALAKILSLVKQIGGYEHSRSCRISQLRASIQSIYRNKREMQGSFMSQPLPYWLEIGDVDLTDLEKMTQKKTSTIKDSRRILRPLAPGFGGSKPIYSNLFVQGPSEFGSFHENESAFIPKLKVVSYKHRVGFFINNQLILCVIKSRHYLLSKVLEHIQNNILKSKFNFDVRRHVNHVRHNCKKYELFANQLYLEGVYAIHAKQICGEKKKFVQSLEEFKARKDSLSLNPDQISFEEFLSLHNGPMTDDIPFMPENEFPAN